MPKVLHLNDECCHFNQWETLSILGLRWDLVCNKNSVTDVQPKNNNRSFYTNTNKGAAVARRSSRRPTTNQSRWFKHPWAGYWARVVPDASITVRMLDRKHLSKKRVDEVTLYKAHRVLRYSSKGLRKNRSITNGTLAAVRTRCRPDTGLCDGYVSGYEWSNSIFWYMYKLGTSEMKAGPEVQHLQRVNYQQVECLFQLFSKLYSVCSITSSCTFQRSNNWSLTGGDTPAEQVAAPVAQVAEQLTY